MSDFIARNRGFLKIFADLLRVVSTALLYLGIVWAALKSVALATRIGDWQALRDQWAESSGVLLFIVWGLAGRVLSQLLRYMHDPEYQPQWLLRHSDKLLYIGTAVYIAYVLLSYLSVVNQRWHEGGWLVFLEASLLLFYLLAMALVMVGLGQILRRLMPVIDDVRTLA